MLWTSRFLIVASFCGSTAFAQPKAGPAPANGNVEWTMVGGDTAETHFSPLTQVNAGNVAQLKQAWVFDTGLTGNFEATPVIVNGVLYGTGPWDAVFAVDARTGKEKWRWDPQLPRTGGPRLCCGAVNRGVAVANGKVFVGLLDARLVALDAATGKIVWDVQTSVDMKESYSITGAPRVVKGKVIIGNGGAENAVRGYASAYDVQTGKLAWRFFMVPGDPTKPFEHPELEMAAKTWTGEWWKYGGGGTPWDGMAYDPVTDLLYIGTGNGGPWDRGFRSPKGGDNLFLASILAIKPDTGRLVWHFQENPGEMWDYTAVQPMILADMNIAGRDRKVLLHAPKNGFFYVLDRVTGEFLSGKPFVKQNWATGLDEKTGRPIEVPGIRYTTTPNLQFPGPIGAHNWPPMSFNPATGLVYLPAQIQAFTYAVDPAYQYNKGGRNLGVLAAPGALPRTPGDPEATAFLLAWDPIAQKEKWRVNYGGGGMSSGTLTTAGNLVFHASGQGTMYAYNAATGAKLWETNVGAGPATPVAYQLDGKEYITILAGRGGAGPGAISHLITFALP